MTYTTKSQLWLRASHSLRQAKVSKGQAEPVDSKTNLRLLLIETVTRLQSYTSQELWILCFLNSRFSKKATKFETTSHLIWHLLSKCQIKWEIVSNFCGLSRLFELYIVAVWTQKNLSTIDLFWVFVTFVIFMKMLSNFSPWLPNLPEKKVQNLFELLKCLGYITFQGLWNQVSFPLIDSLLLFHLTGMLTYFFFFKGNCWSELMILWFVLFLFYYKTMFFKSLQFHKVFGKQILQTEYDVMNNNRILKLSFSEKTTKNSHNNLPQGFDICSVNVKTMRKILQFFLTFSEKLNFNAKNLKILFASICNF